MKVKLAYPKISDSKGFLPKSCMAFEKIDGTNIHFLWTPFDGFSDFGTRRDRFKLNICGVNDFKKAHPGLEQVHEIFYKDYCRPLEYYLFEQYEKSATEIIIFAEYWGLNSFAGNHKAEDQKYLTIFDVMIDGNIIPPEELVKRFKGYDLAGITYKGKYTGQFVEDVRNGKYNVKEGVVCKGVHQGQVYMCKVKTNAYMERLKSEFKDNWKDYWE